MTINEFMSHDHRVCDEQFSKCETLVDQTQWEEAAKVFQEFQHHMLQHFKMEEQVMFEEFNKQANEGCNPTGVMIMEHDQMRQIMEQMDTALENKDKEKFLGLSENMLFVMGQHNMKEEQMMYNLADSVLDSEDIIQKMQEKADGEVQ